MKVKDIYAQYQIMPQLSEHMRRVAGVGELILKGWKEEIDRDLVIRTLLLHDMGNIVKFDLTNPLMPLSNIAHWKKVQAEWWHKYGRDTHEVTKKIVEELGQMDVSRVFDEEHGGYLSGKTEQILDQSASAKILVYADVRVIPTGVVPMKQRIEDLNRRYGRGLSWYNFLYQLEEEIEKMTATDLTTITEEAVRPMMNEWLEYEIMTP